MLSNIHCYHLRGSTYIFENNEDYILTDIHIDIDYYYKRKTIIKYFPLGVTLNPDESFEFLLKRAWGAIDLYYLITYKYINNDSKSISGRYRLIVEK